MEKSQLNGIRSNGGAENPLLNEALIMQVASLLSASVLSYANKS